MAKRIWWLIRTKKHMDQLLSQMVGGRLGLGVYTFTGLRVTSMGWEGGMFVVSLE